MKIFLSSAAVLSIAISGAVFAESTFDMEIKNGTLAEAANLVNGFCKAEMAPIEVKNPSEVVSIKFESTSCKDAAKLIRDFDAKKA